MNTAVSVSENAVEKYYEEIGIIREFCEKVMQPWAEITAALNHSGEAVSRFYLDRARSHYDSER